MIRSPFLEFDWLAHGFGLRDSVPPPDLTIAKQIHSAQVLDACGRRGEQIGEGDAIVSAEPGVAIGIKTADCVPILLADPETRVVACAHAGWRGTAANIVAATVERMKALGAREKNIVAAIGPSIGPCCYEVSAETAAHFDRWRSATPGEYKPHLDLPAINERQLTEAGVHRIWKSGECTYCRADRYFSFRRESEQAGRMLSFVSRVA
ncbi:MAG TPA: peptidoglycan editing factor PgeF [Bryobacteraceae bacterium]|nr:peptidoglycan editing factor PgeF [Bryobacteraceae bacterium]